VFERSRDDALPADVYAISGALHDMNQGRCSGSPCPCPLGARAPLGDGERNQYDAEFLDSAAPRRGMLVSTPMTPLSACAGVGIQKVCAMELKAFPLCNDGCPNR